MLIEIYCEKFKKNGTLGNKIIFKRGLNTIKGISDDNSIGKSMLLMIIDFIFGGDTLLKKYKNDIDIIGHHTICCTFDFSNKMYYFARNTKDKNLVYICEDKNYKINKDKNMTIEDYRRFLQKSYNLDYFDLTFRGAIGTFNRMYTNNEPDPENPLKGTYARNGEDTVNLLFKLFDKYELYYNQKLKKDEAAALVDAFSKATKTGLIPIAKNNTEVKSNRKRIEELKKLIKSDEEKLIINDLNLTAEKERRLLDLQTDRHYYLKKEKELNMQIKLITKEMLYDKKTSKDIEELKEFFPNVNLKAIQDVELFHKKLEGELNEEFENSLKSLNNSLKFTEEKLDEISKKIADVIGLKNREDVEKILHSDLTDHTKELEKLTESNNNVIKKKQLAEDAKNAKKEYNDLFMNESQGVETKVNKLIEELNAYIYENKRYAPSLKITGFNGLNYRRYRKDEFNDSGEGVTYASIMMFDLAILELTTLPLVIYDTKLPAAIEEPTIEHIFEKFNESNKQIFIATDKKKTFNQKTTDILEATKVIELGTGKDALYGREWKDEDLEDDGKK